jgi:hypothetical protein
LEAGGDRVQDGCVLERPVVRLAENPSKVTGAKRPVPYRVICVWGERGVSVLREFYVTCRVEKWYVDEGTESHGPYLSRYDAIADAVEAAKLLAKPKKPIEVILKVRGSGAELIWSSRKSYVPVPNSFALDNQKQLEGVGR